MVATDNMSSPNSDLETQLYSSRYRYFIGEAKVRLSPLHFRTETPPYCRTLDSRNVARLIKMFTLEDLETALSTSQLD